MKGREVTIIHMSRLKKVTMLALSNTIVGVSTRTRELSKSALLSKEVLPLSLYKVYLFFQKSNEYKFDQVFRKIYQYSQYEIYII